MKDAKSLLLLLVSLFLVLLSFVLLWSWGFRLYNKNESPILVTSAPASTEKKIISNNLQDSLQLFYNQSLTNLELQLDTTLINSDSLNIEIDKKLEEFYRLRNAIELLMLNHANSNDIRIAKQKLIELQAKVIELKDKNTIVENENKKLGELLSQLKNSETKSGKTISLVQVPKQGIEKTSQNFTGFAAMDLRLSAFSTNEEKEYETLFASQTEKLVGSFTVLNNSAQQAKVEMVVVIVQPDGRVLKTSGWESGTFETKEGKSIYSYKLNFNYLKGEPKHLLFSLSSDNFQKGIYTMQVFYNGTMIGKTIKPLS